MPEKILSEAQNDKEIRRDSVRLPLTRELSSDSETEGETEFLQCPRHMLIFLFVRLFAAQKSTLLKKKA